MELDDGEPAKKPSSKPAIKAASTLNPQTGVTLKAVDKFSAEKWGLTTRRYVKSIHNLKEGSLEDIVNRSKKFMSPFKCRQLAAASAAIPDTLDDDDDDIRACLVEEWHVLSRTMLWFRTLTIPSFL